VILGRKETKFERLEDLLAIEGISRHRLEMIRPYVRIGQGTPDQSAAPSAGQ
jgi:hypothetical protein